MAPEKSLPTKPSDVRFAQPQGASGDPAKMSPPLERECPECNKVGAKRGPHATTLHGKMCVHTCRVGHTWSPKNNGGSEALKVHAAARKRMAEARLKVPAPVDGSGMGMKFATIEVNV